MSNFQWRFDMFSHFYEHTSCTNLACPVNFSGVQDQMSCTCKTLFVMSGTGLSVVLLIYLVFSRLSISVASFRPNVYAKHNSDYKTVMQDSNIPSNFWV